MPEEIFELLLSDVFTKEEHPYQDREYNYVFEVTTWDPETGEIIVDHEFRTLADDQFYSDMDALEAIHDYYSEQYGISGGD